MNEGLGPCLLWTGATNGRYGVLSEHGRNIYAHRRAYEVANGPIPEGMLVCHHCDTPLCVEPRHLFVGTQADNMRDARLKGRVTPYHPNPGERNGRALLTRAQVDEIRQTVTPNKTGIKGGGLSEAARRYGVSRREIKAILTGESWRP